MTMVTLGLERELEEMANEELRRDAAASSTATSTAGSTASASSKMKKPVAPVTSAMALRRSTLPETTSADDRNLALGTHLGTLAATLFSGGLLDIIVPVVAYVTLKDRSAFLKEHIRQQLNFQLTMFAATVVAVVGTIVTVGLGAFVAVPALLVMLLVDIVASIKGAVAASRGEEYRFPLTIDFVKGD